MLQFTQKKRNFTQKDEEFNDCIPKFSPTKNLLIPFLNAQVQSEKRNLTEKNEAFHGI